MARKARQRISYVLPLANSPGGHRLGVNGLAVDAERSILYSGGRDGLICAWNLNIKVKPGIVGSKTSVHSPEQNASYEPKVPSSSTFRQQVQAHTQWVNDIILTQSNLALVSASSDITVKVWRPHSEESQVPTTIGLHSDYVKCLASPGRHLDWVASGGLDHKIKIWDLNGGGEKLHIDIAEHEASAKGSVYALSVRGSIMASGGPESIVRLWDPKSGKRITNFVGHTDNIRDILINEDGDTVMTASSDRTVKVWSVTAGRCMHTLTMHNDSVWSLFSDHPQLSIFYSSDRLGVVAKTDVRGSLDMDEGLSIAIAKEHDGVNKVIVAEDYVWTATSSSSINRWKDVDLMSENQASEPARTNRVSSLNSRSKVPSPTSPSFIITSDLGINPKIPLSCILRISNNAIFPGQTTHRDAESSTIYSGISARKLSEAIVDPELGIVIPYHDLPEETIEGQNGLIKHVMLNDRKRVLTLDTAGEVMMWDILKCIPIQSFGKRHLEDVTPEVNTIESVANWCAVDTRTGRLACVLEENYCFDAEMYADELGTENTLDFRDDQRINLGKWVLRYLFNNLIEEELKRDSLYRASLGDSSQRPNTFRRNNAPPQLQLPVAPHVNRQNGNFDNDSQITPRAAHEDHQSATTPGLSIGIATPHPSQMSNNLHAQNHLPSTNDERTSLEKQHSHQSQSRTSSDRSADYFSNNPNRQSYSEDHVKVPTTPSDGTLEAASQSPVDADKEEKSKEGTTLFGKKFRMNFPKKLGRSSVEAKPVAVDQKSEASDKSEGKEDKNVDDNFLGTIQKIRYDYEEQLHYNAAQSISTGLSPSPPTETPLLRLPPFTTVIIHEDRPDSGGVADLYRGIVKSLGHDADLIEKAAPMWLGDLLLKNQIPFKEISKVSFILLPYQDLLPSIASLDGNSRLNANRMLRAKKILAYVAERIEPQSEQEDPNALKPEEYLELYCHNQLVTPTTTLATLRAHIWKTGGDVMLYYKSNGQKPSLEQRISHNDSLEESYAMNGSSAMKA